MTVLADYGSRYQSKLFNPEFLRSKNLPVPEWLERKIGFIAKLPCPEKEPLIDSRNGRPNACSATTPI